MRKPKPDVGANRWTFVEGLTSGAPVNMDGADAAEDVRPADTIVAAGSTQEFHGWDRPHGVSGGLVGETSAATAILWAGSSLTVTGGLDACPRCGSKTVSFEYSFKTEVALWRCEACDYKYAAIMQLPGPRPDWETRLIIRTK